MRTLLLATGNQGKVEEVARFLSGTVSRCLSPKDIPGKVPPEVHEDGSTYFENALKKAVHYQRLYGLPVLADDSGLEVQGLEWGPGVLSARFGGVQVSWPERWKLLQEKLRGLAPAARTARFRCVLCFYDGEEVPRFFEGVTEGRIAPEARGGNGFGYDPVFFSTELGKTFGEASSVEKEEVSHRTRALEGFVRWIRDFRGDEEPT